MDTGPTLGIIVLAAAALLLVVVSLAEAGVSAVSRRRVHRYAASGVAALLRDYIRQRQRVLSALSVAASVAIVAGTMSLTLLLLHDRHLEAWNLVGAGLLSVLAVSFFGQTARIVALLNPEVTGYRMARVISLLQVVFTPLDWLAGWPARLIVRLIAGDRERREENPATELLALIEEPQNSGEPDTLAEERRMMRAILEMSNQTVREIMSPRMDITAVPVEASIGDVMKLINTSGFSRIPLYEDSIDHIVGVLYAKDLLAYLQSGVTVRSLRDVARPPYFVPETKRADELLTDMRRDKVHMAIVVDEYGGTAGVVTVEDLIEEIVGEISDEYDVEEVDVQRLSETEAIVDARLPVDDLNELFGTSASGEDFDTVGGFIFSQLGRLAVPGDVVEIPEHRLRIEVLSLHGRRIKKVRVSHIQTADEAVQAV